MQLRIVRETGYLRADLRGRETPEQMREALWAILAECRRCGVSARLLEHQRSGIEATHYSWEISREPVAREGELLRAYREAFGRLPRLNAPTSPW